MAYYYVNVRAQPNGDHEVHEQGCRFMPLIRRDLGEHPNCQSAIKGAKKIYPESNGCFYCSYPCHTG